MPWQRCLTLLKAVVKTALRKITVLPNFIKSELMLHKAEKISLIGLCRNLQVSRYSALFQIHRMLSRSELSPIQGDKGITRDDKVRHSQQKKPCLCLHHLCVPGLHPQQPPESAAFEPLRAVKLKTGQTGTGTSLAIGWGTSKWLKLTLPHPSSGCKKESSGAELDCFFTFHAWKSCYVLAES